MAGPTHLFNVYWMKDQSTKGGWIGGSYDNISIVTIMCALYQVRQNRVADQGLLMACFDSTDTLIAAVGPPDTPPTQTGPADPVPTLASLQPDSSGNWNAEITLTGTNFTATSEVLANGNPVTPVTHDSSTQLRAIAPATAAGPYQITVRNGTQVSNALTFTAL